MRVLGLDPSLVACGWGIVDMDGTKLRHIGHGVIRPPKSAPLHERLSFLYAKIEKIIEEAAPDTAGVEEAFMKDNAMSALKLGHARAVCLLAPSRAGLSVGEYSARAVKKSVTGTGAADKAQIAAMINVLLPAAGGLKAGDAADALAIAICHGHHMPAALRTAL